MSKKIFSQFERPHPPKGKQEETPPVVQPPPHKTIVWVTRDVTTTGVRILHGEIFGDGGFKSSAGEFYHPDEYFCNPKAAEEDINKQFDKAEEQLRRKWKKLEVKRLAELTKVGNL